MIQRIIDRLRSAAELGSPNRLIVPWLCVFVPVCLAAGVGPLTASNPAITILVNGTPVALDVNPRWVEGRLVAPIVPVVNRMGARATWDEHSRTLRIQYRPGSLEPTRARVVAVFDGDTLKVSRLEGPALPSPVVRLIGINAPETSGEQRDLGRRARQFAVKQLSGETVWLSRDVSEVDRYGRSLRYAWMKAPPDTPSARFVRGHMVNALLVRKGYARTATYPPDVRYAAVFRRLEREAREAGRGLWESGEGTGSDTVDSTSGDKGGTYHGPYNPKGADRDCGDFSGRAQAQAFYEAAGGPGVDPHRLDRDGDGRACESLP